MRLVCSTAGLFVVVLLVGCAPKGDTAEAKRNDVETMKQQTLAQLYALAPRTQEAIASAEGYAVFSCGGAHVAVLGAGFGFGVITDNVTGWETYMRVARVTGGLGLGPKHFRVVFIFHDAKVLQEFRYYGWEFGSEADAAAKLDETGDAAAAAGTFTRAVDIYQITEDGLTVRAVLTGTRYYRDDELNAHP